MKRYYRFQNDEPRHGDDVHCFTSLDQLRQFARMMESQDPDFRRMRFWVITGTLVGRDEGDAVVRVMSAKRIRL